MTCQSKEAELVFCEVKPEDCVNETRSKWLCAPGIHPSDYFQCLEWAPQIDKLNNPDKRIHFNEHLDRVKHPLDPLRIWESDSNGLRKMDWYPSDLDCVPPKTGNFEYVPVCTDKPTCLTGYFNVLTNFSFNHRRKILEDYVYRNPDQYLTEKEQNKYMCDLICNAREYKDPKPMNQRDIMRMRFMTNNYTTFDDWKNDPEDEILNDIEKNINK